MKENRSTHFSSHPLLSSLTLYSVASPSTPPFHPLPHSLTVYSAVSPSTPQYHPLLRSLTLYSVASPSTPPFHNLPHRLIIYSTVLQNILKNTCTTKYLQHNRKCTFSEEYMISLPQRHSTLPEGGTHGSPAQTPNSGPLASQMLHWLQSRHCQPPPFVSWHSLSANGHLSI